MSIFTYRYMWKLSGSDQINLKIVTDTVSGLESFEKALLELPNLDSACKEYLQEYDCLKFCKVDILKGDN